MTDAARRTRIAVDAMGGDRAPAEIVQGACRGADDLDVDVLLVGRRSEIEPHIEGDVELRANVSILDTPDVIAMHAEPASAVRGAPDSSIVQCVRAVKDGDADALVSAGNTGAVMAASVLRLGRIKGVARPAIALPIPVPGGAPQILVDGGATVDCQPEWLAQFARLGGAYSTLRCGHDEPRIALLSNGEEPGKGDALRKAAYEHLASVKGFVGNCEGRDLLSEDIDVIVTDGFTGNVALKTLEGALRRFSALVLGVLDSTPELRAASEIVIPPLLDAAGVFDPDETGGAMLLGVRGVTVISHGSSSARAIVNAMRVAADGVSADVVARLSDAIADAG